MFHPKRFLFTATLAALSVIVNAPHICVAQTTGLGWDGYTRQLWRANDQHISLWVLDPYLNFAYGYPYGPYSGWYPVAITTGNNNYSYVLWRTTTGIAAIWLVDPYLNYVGSAITTQEPGWTPESVSTGTSPTNIRLTWRRYDGALAIWSFDQNLNLLTAASYGPFYGFDPGPAPESVVRNASIPKNIAQAMASAEASHITPAMARAHVVSAKRAAKAMSHFGAARDFTTIKR